MALKKSFLHSPGRLLILSIITIIFIGTLLLSLPQSQLVPHSLIDLFFTATSATCVTGLLTIPLAEFTFFGKTIILFLMQIGGLGLITMTVFLISLFFQVGMKTHLMAGQLLELESWNNSKRMIKFIILLTFGVEAIGTLLLWAVIPSQLAGDHPLFTALFHSVSSFCSAGFSIFSQGIEAFSHNIPFLVITMALIMVGELGFITWHELARAAKATYYRRWFKLSLHTKLVLYCSSTIVWTTTILFFILEKNIITAHNSPLQAFVNTLFNVVSFRSCGFLTLPLFSFHIATLIIMMIVAFIGVSPGSTGSGIKVTTLALLMATVKAVMTGRSEIEIRERRIPDVQIFKALAIVTLATTWIIFSTLLLLIVEPNVHQNFLPYFFESVSAFTNLGSTLNLTPFLSSAGKIIISIGMILGRIGALTLILAIKTHKDSAEFHYPEERVMLS